MRLRDKERFSEYQFADDFEPLAANSDPWDIVFDTPVAEESPMSPERIEQSKRLQKVLDGLSNKERIILLTRFENYHPLKGKQQFHPDDLERLARDLDMTKDYIRQTYNRTLHKVKKQLSLS